MTDPGAGALGWWDEPGANTRLERVTVAGVLLKPGDHVRLHPRRSADAFDILLAGRTAQIESIEQDFENQVYLAVTIDDDPGRGLGELRQPGHRFFYSTDEVEPLEPGPAGAQP